jgi:predicted O-methyltransferase YrrM
MAGGGATWARRLARTPVVGPALIAGLRLWIAARHVGRSARAAARWLVASRETTNFTYELTPLNLGQLAAFVAAVADIGIERAEAYLREVAEDEGLRDHIARVTAASPDAHFADTTPRYGRRLGWYALVRALRPGVVVETGVDKGLGACVFAAALERNAAEGHPGFYCGIDRNPAAGYLLAGRYARFGQLLLGDSIEQLKGVERIDFFVHDSDHAAAHEAREYETVESRLSEGAIVLSDNAHCTDELRAFARRTGRRFLFFAERPADHWYPGGGIGAAFS